MDRSLDPSAASRGSRSALSLGGAVSLPPDASAAEIAAQPDDRALNPAKKPAKKTQSAQTPAMNLPGTAVNPMGLPSNSMGLPSNSMGIPSNSMGIPSNSMGLPSNSMGLPSNSMGIPSNSMGLPSNSLAGLNLPSNSLSALASSRGYGGNSGISGTGGSGKGNRRSKKNKMMKNAEQYVIDPRKVESNEDPRQFLMIRNIPNSISQEELLSILETYVQGEIEFLYLPIDKVTSCNLGYGYVSLLNCSSVLKLYNAVGCAGDVSCRCTRRDGRSPRV